MKKNFCLISLIAMLFLGFSCVDDEKYIYTYESNPVFSWGYTQFYGAFYSDKDITNNVVSLSLFTDSLDVSDDGNLTGFGQYLFIEDIFINPEDSILPAGTYTNDSTYQVFTFNAGKEEEIDGITYQIGSYMLFIEKDESRSKIQFIKDGNFTVTHSGNKTIIQCTLTLDNDSIITGNFNAQLYNFDQSAKVKSNIRKTKVKLPVYLN